jgi:hypothetical protein
MSEEETKEAIGAPSVGEPAAPAAAPTQTPPRVALDVGQDFATGYRILNADGSSGPAGPATHIASGGAGVVFRAAYHELPHRAIKVLAPRPDLLERVGWDKFEVGQSSLERDLGGRRSLSDPVPRHGARRGRACSLASAARELGDGGLITRRARAAARAAPDVGLGAGTVAQS